MEFDVQFITAFNLLNAGNDAPIILHQRITAPQNRARRQMAECGRQIFQTIGAARKRLAPGEGHFLFGIGQTMRGQRHDIARMTQTSAHFGDTRDAAVIKSAPGQRQPFGFFVQTLRPKVR